jgi:hypothetical protein
MYFLKSSYKGDSDTENWCVFSCGSPGRNSKLDDILTFIFYYSPLENT